MKFSTLPLLLLLPFLLMEPAAASAAQPSMLKWSRFSGNCSGPNVVACGSRSYVFGEIPSGLAASCGSPSVQTEQVRPYPGNTANYLGGNYPCSDGACLSDIPASGNWVALIDWRNAHGLTVAEILNRVGQGLPVHLFALDSESSPEAIGDVVGDAHVLVQLCAIAAQTSKPEVVNLSFGRYWLEPAKAATSASLEGEIREVLADLADETHVVAAAGNDGLLLFPAVVPEVLSVGGLDLAAFRRGELAPSRISPPTAEAFFPANGLLLEDRDEAWPLAPGSSFASALASGWLATLAPEARDLVFAANGEVLAPIRTGAGYELFLGSERIEGSANGVASRLIDIAALPATDAWSKLKLEAGPSRLERIVVEIDGLPERTWTEVQGRANSPAPDSYPCVPCADAPDPWGGGGGLQTHSLLLDLGGAESFRPGMVLHALYLQSGERVLRFTSSEDVTFLSEIASGVLQHLEIEGLPSTVHDHELLLVWVLKDSSSVQPFVRKTPITRVVWPKL